MLQHCPTYELQTRGLPEQLGQHQERAGAHRGGHLPLQEGTGGGWQVCVAVGVVWVFLASRRREGNIKKFCGVSLKLAAVDKSHTIPVSLSFTFGLINWSLSPFSLSLSLSPSLSLSLSLSLPLSLHAHAA